MRIFSRPATDTDWTDKLAGSPEAAVSPFGGIDDDPTGTPIVTFTPQIVEMLRLGNSTSTYGALYRQQWAVRTCVDFLALNIAHLNLKTYRRTDGVPEDARETPLAKLIQHPNSWMSRYELIRGLVSDLAIYGNAYWWKAFVGESREIYRLPPIWVQPKGGSVIKGPAKYIIDNGAQVVEVDAAEVVHFRGYSPEDPRCGTSLFEALKSVLNEEVEASRHRGKFWRKNARFGGLIERPHDSKWSDKAKERFLQDWKRFSRGGDREEDTAILEDGMKWVAASFSPKDAEFIAGREFVLETVATAMNIPLALLSRKSTMTFASVKEFRTMLYADVLGSWNGQIESTINHQLVPDFGDPDLYVEFNIDEKLQGDFEQQAAAARNSVQVPWDSVNGYRKKRNLDPIGDPEDPSNPYNAPARPSNYTYEGDAPPPPAVAPFGVVPAAANGNGHAADAALASILEDR